MEVRCKDEEMIECALGDMEICVLAGQESRECCVFISDVGIRGIYLSLNLGVLPNSNN